MRYESIARCALWRSLLVVGGCWLAVNSSALWAEGEHDHHHHHAAPSNVLSKTEALYVLPEIKLTRADGVTRDFAKELDASGGPVILNFVYTTCTAICPMTSQVFSSLQQKLAGASLRANLVSISIDPEYDTPARLASYAKKFDAGPNWQFYTGSLKSSVAVQKAFNAYRGDKMNHIPVTFFRMAPGKPWLRVEGMASSDELLEIYKSLAKAS